MKIQALILCGILSLGATQVARADIAPPPGWTAPNKPYRVVGNIYYVGSETLSAYLITSSAGHILLDPGMSAEGAKMVERNIVSLGFKLADVKILINTHAHFDHAGGLAQVKADTGAKVWASRADADRLYTPEWKKFVADKYGAPGDIEYLHSPVMVDNREGTISVAA